MTPPIKPTPDQPLRNGNKSAPEHQDRKTRINRIPPICITWKALFEKMICRSRLSFALFQLKVFNVGNRRYYGLEFVQPLIADVVQ